MTAERESFWLKIILVAVMAVGVLAAAGQNWVNRQSSASVRELIRENTLWRIRCTEEPTRL